MDKVRSAASEITILILNIKRVVGSRSRIGEGAPFDRDPVGALSIHDDATGWERPHESGSAKGLNGVHLYGSGTNLFFAPDLGIAGHNRDFNDPGHRAGSPRTRLGSEGDRTDWSAIPLYRNGISRSRAAIEHRAVATDGPGIRGTGIGGGVSDGFARTNGCHTFQGRRLGIDDLDRHGRGVGAKATAAGDEPDRKGAGYLVGMLWIFFGGGTQVIAEQPLVIV